MRPIPDGTRYALPPEWEWREGLRSRLEGLLASWGYEAVQTPALESYDPGQPGAEKSFKLVDRDGGVLALRGEYTTAVAGLVRSAYRDGPWPLRLRYAGSLWVRTRDPELGRAREYSQVGVELLGVSTPLADAEVVTLALECLRAAGLSAAVELGHPGFVRAVLGETGLSGEALEGLRTAVDRKDAPGLAALLAAHGVGGGVRAAALALPDLYGGPEVLEEAESHALNPEAEVALERLRAVAAELGGASGRFLYDLGMARRYDYYTGVTFRAYTPDFGQPLAGGGRYDGLPTGGRGAGIPAAGFAIGLERLTAALGPPPPKAPPDAVALDAALARELRARGWRVEAAWTRDEAELAASARARGVPHLAAGGRVVRLADGASLRPEEL